MLAPKSVAVIGATEAEGSVGRTLIENLKAGNFVGEIIPVNLKRARVLGIAAFPKVGAVKNPIDLAVIVTPAATVPGITGECAKQVSKARSLFRWLQGMRRSGCWVGEAGSHASAAREDAHHRTELPRCDATARRP